MKTLGTTMVLGLLFVATNGWSQEATPNEAGSAVSVERPSGHGLGKTFWLLGTTLNASMLVDTKSTFDVVGRCDRCVEANPYTAPFIRRGPMTTYASAELFDVGVMVAAARMKHSDRIVLRKTWWLVPAALAAGHAIAYRHNLSVAR